MRKKRSMRKLSLKVVPLILVCLAIVGVSYAYLSGNLNIKGKVTGKITDNYKILPGSDPNLKITATKIGNWQEGSLFKYKYSFRVDNIGQDVITNFTMSVVFLNVIDSVTIINYEYSIKGKSLTVINNNSIKSGESLVIELVISTRASNQLISTIFLEVKENGNEITPEKFPIVFNIINSAPQYSYEYNVTATNKTGVKINGWQIDIMLPEGTSYVSGTGALFSASNNVISITNNSSNGRLKNGESTTFSLILTTNIANYIPNNIKVTVR